MKSGFVVTDEEVERRMRDAAQLFNDACLAALSQPGMADQPAEQLQGQALSLAVQMLFMADQLVPGAETEKRFYKAEPKDTCARVQGLASGLGHVISMNTHPLARSIYLILATSTLEKAATDRSAFTAAVKK